MTKKILVIEDDSAILESLHFLLEYAGYEVDTKEDGNSLDEKLEEARPDLILLDYWLPKQNGGEITRMLKSREDTRDIPIIILSASYNIKDLVEKAGADDFLPKPYDMDILLQRVERCISNSELQKNY